MKNVNIKKSIIGLVMAAAVVSGVSCSPRSKAMEALEGKEGVFAVFDLTQGEVAVELYYKKTPMTVSNFVGLAEGTLDAAKGKPFYDGLKFHRVISVANGDGQDFMIQGGDPKGNGTGGPGYKFPDEFVTDLNFDKPGKLAMANSGADTNGSQFFITIAETEWLNQKHTIFGEVVYGQDVVNKTLQNDVIKSVKIVRKGKDAEAFKPTQKSFDELVVQVKKANEEAKIKEFEDLVKGFEKTSDGIFYKIVEEGKGTPVGKNKKVKVEYMGYLTSGQLFDASKGFHPQGHEPLEFTTSAGQMIEGFDKMVQEMKLGETRKMVLPPELAYGAMGYPGVIPGNAYICFDVKIIQK